MAVVLITGQKNEFDKRLAAVFSRAGHRVYIIGSEQIAGVTLLPLDLNEAVAALKKESILIDIYVDVSDERCSSDNFDIRSGINDETIRKLYDANVIQPMSMFETFLPLMKEDGQKRLCFLHSAQASINEASGSSAYGYAMAKAGLSNFLQITRNVLAPKGFTMRVFDPCLTGDFPEMNPEKAAQAALNYFIRKRGIERGNEQRDDEGTLVFRDAYGRQHCW